MITTSYRTSLGTSPLSSKGLALLSKITHRRTRRINHLPYGGNNQTGNNQEGAMVLETALVLPVFILILFGFFEFSMAFASYMNATYATRIGARYAAMHSLSSASPASTADVQNVVKSQLFLPGLQGSGFSNNNIIVLYGNRSFSTASPGNYQGDLVGVGIYWQQNIIIPFYKTEGFIMSTQAYRVIVR